MPQPIAKLVLWVSLIILSAVLAGLLSLCGLPAALLLGPMIAGILITLLDKQIGVSGIAFSLAQGVIGCLIARMIPLSLLSGDTNWFIVVFGALSVIGASAFLGWLLVKKQLLPGTTAVWGLSPGAASVMVIMSEDFGDDAQVVAFMQYFRVVMVAGIASLMARFLGESNGSAAAHSLNWFAAIDPLMFAKTLLLALAGPLCARVTKIPTCSLLVPFFAGVVLVQMGFLKIELPQMLLAFSYAVIGWRIGLRFTRPLLIHIGKLLPSIVCCIAGLLLLCACIAGLFVITLGIDPLTAYLATSPGGADSVAIIASSTKVDTRFVMVMQTIRFLVVLLAGPFMAKSVAKQQRSKAEN